MHSDGISCVSTLSTQRVGLYSSTMQTNLRRSDCCGRARPSRGGFSKTIGIVTKVKIKTWNSPARKAFQFLSVNFVFLTSDRESESRATAATTPTGLREDWLYVFCLERSLAANQTYRFIMTNWGRCVNDRVPSFLVTSQWIVKLPLKKNWNKKKSCYTTIASSSLNLTSIPAPSKHPAYHRILYFISPHFNPQSNWNTELQVAHSQGQSGIIKDPVHLLVLAETTEFLTVLYFCDARASFDGCNMAWTKREKKRQDISTQLARPKAADFFEHLLCCLRVLSQAQLFWLWLQNAISWGEQSWMGRGSWMCRGKLSELSPYANQRHFL